MNTLKLGKSVLLIAALAAYMLIVGYIRDNWVNPQYKLLVNFLYIGLLVSALIIRLSYQERSNNKPNYKIYFYSTLFIFLFVSIALVLSKR